MSTTDLAQQVADLTTATTQLTQEVVGQKARLTAAADTATSKASDASGSASAASASATSANAAAAAAETSKNQAAEISGLDTVEEAVDMALSEYAGVLTAAQRQAIIDANEEKYAASGFVHYGKQHTTNAINEGMYASSNPNEIYMGRYNAGSPVGTSKTEQPVSHIAGVVSGIEHINSSSTISCNWLKLPPAPDGTVIYDSTGDARGTGKANLNLLTEVDPKYGDIAATHNEAVARAFEGAILNGDGRLGNNGSWVYNNKDDGSLDVSEGKIVVTLPTTGSGNSFLRPNCGGLPETGKVKVRFFCEVKPSGFQTYLFPGDGTYSNTGLNVGWNEVVIERNGPQQALITFQGPTRDGSTGIFSNFSVVPVTEEVVTDRVDMFGLEQFDMVMKDDEIFDMVQSQSTTFGDTDVPTVTSVRPESFFAVYDGQEDVVKGRCVKWSTLTDVQKRKVAAYMKERLWINEDGDLTFTTIRQRSFAGAGNGDWTNIAVTGTLPIIRQGNLVVRPQGNRDTALSDTGAWHAGYGGINYPDSGKGIGGYYKGSFTANAVTDTAVAYAGRCFFYVLGTVSRLNQGAYHPSLNPLGASKFRTASQTHYALFWYTTDIPAQSTRDCFYLATHVTGAGGLDRGVNYCGNPDGRFYDAIYASGLGGVIDHRPKYGAWDASRPEQAAEVFQEVVSGKYRGVEKLPLNGVTIELPSVGKDSTGGYIEQGRMLSYDPSTKSSKITNQSPHYAGDLYGTNWILVRKSDGKIVKPTLWVNKYHLRLDEWDGNSWVGITEPTENYETEYFGFWFTGKFDSAEYPITSLLYTRIPAGGIFGYSYTGDKPSNSVHAYISVSGEFTQTDVIGDPAQIFATPQLKNGWVGSWIPVIPDGVVDSVPLSRKVSGASSTRQIVYTDSNGSSWSSGTPTINEVANSHDNTHPAGRIAIYNYQAFAKQTKQSVNRRVLHAESGLGRVFASSHYAANAGSLLAESTLGLIDKNSVSGIRLGNYSLLSFGIGSDGSLTTSKLFTPVKHANIDLVAPNNGSSAIKVLSHPFEDNHQASLNFIANELKHDGIDWGDDGAMKAIENGTYTNLNGEVCLADIHELAIPYGYVKH